MHRKPAHQLPRQTNPKTAILQSMPSDHGRSAILKLLVNVFPMPEAGDYPSVVSPRNPRHDPSPVAASGDQGSKIIETCDMAFRLPTCVSVYILEEVNFASVLSRGVNCLSGCLSQLAARCGTASGAFAEPTGYSTVRCAREGCRYLM